jgi:ElaB/YqjD/DUF883 family membrane-anchored ribosome-binding protein
MTGSELNGASSESLIDVRRNFLAQADSAREGASNALLSAADAIRAEAQKANSDDVMQQANKIADSIERAAVYLDSHTFEQMGEDVREVVTENPLRTLIIAFFIGLVLGLLFGNRD